MAGLVLVLVRAHLDRRIWTRSDVVGRGIGPVLPVVPDDGDERDVALAGVAQVSSGTERSVDVVAVDQRSLPLAATVATAINGAALARTIDGLVPASGTPGAVWVVGSVGASSTDDLVRIVEYVDALGFELAGVVLGGVGAQGARRANS